MQVHDSVFDLDEDEHRRLALRDPLEQVRVVGEALGKLGELLRELEQQLQAVALLELQEVVADLSERLGKFRQGPLRARRP
jgi:hypothetical protein